MGNSSQGSSDESSDKGTIVQNEGTSSVKAKFCCNKSDNKKNCKKSNISLTQLNWNYKFIGSHRIIELEFHCSNCNSHYYVLMDKTSYLENGKRKRRKNIQMKAYNFNNIHWQVTQYKVERYISFDTCFDKFDSIDASSYNWATNNCMHFAYKIKNKILNNK